MTPEQIRCGAESSVTSGDSESGGWGGGCVLRRRKLRRVPPMTSPVSHGDLFQHGGAGVGLPVARNGRPPAKAATKAWLRILAGAALISALTTAIHTYTVFMQFHGFEGGGDEISLWPLCPSAFEAET